MYISLTIREQESVRKGQYGEGVLIFKCYWKVENDVWMDKYIHVRSSKNPKKRVENTENTTNVNALEIKNPKIKTHHIFRDILIIFYFHYAIHEYNLNAVAL